MSELVQFLGFIAIVLVVFLKARSLTHSPWRILSPVEEWDNVAKLLPVPNTNIGIGRSFDFGSMAV